MTARLQNLYIARLTTQERPCFVCSKFTSVVLTLADNSNNDWFYTCRSHLGDFNFCSKVGGVSPKPNTAPSTPKASTSLKDRPAESDSVVDLVSSIGSALTSWRKKPDNDSKDKDDKDDKGTTKNDKEATKDDKDAATEETDKDVTTPSSPPPLTSSPQPQVPPKFILQRDYFYLRQREYTKKQQKKEAEQKLKTLQFPKVPTDIPKPL